MATNLKLIKPLDNPDERRELKGHGHVDVVHFGKDVTIGRVVFEPGWDWEKDVGPIAGTATCQAEHAGYCLSGEVRIKMDSGEEFSIREGDSYYLPPGHTGHVVGNRAFVGLDFIGMAEYAKAREKKAAAA